MRSVTVFFVALYIHSAAARERLMISIASMPTLRVLGVKFELYSAHSLEDINVGPDVCLSNIHTLLVDARAERSFLPEPEHGSTSAHANLRTIAVAFDLRRSLKDNRDLDTIRKIMLQNPGVTRFIASHEEPFPPTKLQLQFLIPQSIAEISVPAFISLIHEDGCDTVPNLVHVTLQTDIFHRTFEQRDAAIRQLEQRIKNMNRVRFQGLTAVHLRGIRTIRSFGSEQLRFDSCLRALLLSSRLSMMNVTLTDEFYVSFPRNVRFTVCHACHE